MEHHPEQNLEEHPVLHNEAKVEEIPNNIPDESIHTTSTSASHSAEKNFDELLISPSSNQSSGSHAYVYENEKFGTKSVLTCFDLQTRSFWHSSHWKGALQEKQFKC